MSRLRTAFRAVTLCALLMAAACTADDEPTGVGRLAPGARISLSAASTTGEACLGGQPTPFPVGNPPVLGPGDYYSLLVADPATTLAGDGWHFTRLTDAVKAARDGRIARGEQTWPQAACRITILVAAGTWRGSFTGASGLEAFPLLLDVPRLTLQGALQLALDGKGRPTGAAADPASVTTLQPDAGMVSSPPQAIVIVTDNTDGFHGDSVTVRGFAFQSGYSSGTTGGGYGIFSLRAQGLVVEDNRFGPLLTSAVDLEMTAARVARNYAQNLTTEACAFCLSGPGSFAVIANTIIQSGIVGIYVTPFSIPPAIPPGVQAPALPTSAVVSGTVQNNLIRDQVVIPVGTALRISPVGRSAAGIGQQAATFTVSGNELVHNRFGMILDAGFPGAPNTSTTLPTGDLSVAMGGNSFTGSCETNLLVALVRHTRALGLPMGDAGFLKRSTYTIALGGDLPWSSVWYAHPQVGGGVTLNNSLIVDGTPIANGQYAPYNPAACAAAPVALPGGPYTGSEGVNVTFDGSQSTGTGLSYQWAFGDGTTGTGVQPVHRYANEGTYQVGLVVTDASGVTSLTATTTVTIAPAAPQPVVEYIGLKNSDDVGTKFDLLAEILKNGVPIATGQLDGVNGGSSGFNNAVKRTVSAAFASVPDFGPGDELAVRLSVRIAVGVAGHTSGTARLWYNDSAANSGFTTMVNGVSRTFYLGNAGGNLVLLSAPGTARTSVDATVSKTVNGNAFKPFGTWKVTF